MRVLVVSLTALGLLAGCASSSSDWAKAGASDQELGRDTADCLAGAQMMVSGGQGPPRTVIQQDRYRRCMTNRGYVEQPQK